MALPLIALDIFCYIVSLAWLSKLAPKKAYSVAVGDSTETRGKPRRHFSSPEKLVTSIYDGGNAKTVYDMTIAAVKENGPNTALVSRKFVELKKIKETDRFPSKFYDDNELDEITYDELGEMIVHFGAGLKSLGMESIPQLGAGESFDDATGSFVMVIFEDTCKQWTIGLHGAFSQSITVATCYATLGEDAVIGAVNETNASTLFLNWKNAEKFSQLASKMPSLKTIIASTYEMPEGTPTPLAKRG